MWKEFYSILIQLSSKMEGTFFAANRKIFVFLNEKNKIWIFATKITDYNQNISPQIIKEIFLYQEKAMFISLHSFLSIKNYDGKGIYYMQELPPLQGYISFKKAVSKYLYDTSLWEELFYFRSKKNLFERK